MGKLVKPHANVGRRQPRLPERRIGPVSVPEALNRVAEQAPVNKVFKRPHHPYTWGLLGSLPRLDTDLERLVQIPGQPPSLLRPPSGCRFHPRCPYVMDKCKTVEPPLVPISDDLEHLQACHLDEATKDREAQKLLEATMVQAS